MMKRFFNGINVVFGIGIFFYFFIVDRNKGDIERKVCMDFVELKRVDGYFFRKMIIVLVIYFVNVYY